MSCCVPNCTSIEEPRVSFFSFPEEEQMVRKWLNILKRENEYHITRYEKVCEKHFREEDIERLITYYDSERKRTMISKLDVPRLKKTAIPYVSPIHHDPSYLTSPLKKPRDDMDMESRNCRTQLEEAAFNVMFSEERNLRSVLFSNFNEFLICLKRRENSTCFHDWVIVKKTSLVMFLWIRNSENIGPQVDTAVIVNDNLSFEVFRDGLRIRNSDRLDNFNTLEKILDEQRENDQIRFG